MVVKSVNLETVIGITSKLPDNHMLEVAFAGRSNVGKSSLINRLLNRTQHSAAHRKPISGKTQTLPQSERLENNIPSKWSEETSWSSHSNIG